MYPSDRLRVRLTEAHQSRQAVTSIPGSLGGPYDPSSLTVTLALRYLLVLNAVSYCFVSVKQVSQIIDDR